LRVVWQIMSLSVLNEGRDDDPENDPDGFLWGPARLFAAIQHRYGPEAVGRFYDRYGAMAHSGDWEPRDGGPEKFYLKLGFRPTGEQSGCQTVGVLDL
jgi:hypothetical protein